MKNSNDIYPKRNFVFCIPDEENRKPTEYEDLNINTQSPGTYLTSSYVLFHPLTMFSEKN